MKKPFAGALLALALLGLGAAPAAASAAQAPAPASAPAPVAAPAAVTVDFAGTVALSNCSGSLVRLPRSQPDDPALVLSNGHCLEGGMPGPGVVVVDRPSTRTFSLLNSSGRSVATLRASKIAYATMTDTDVSLYQLTTTYRQIESRYRIKALELDTVRPAQGTAIKVVSGYWKRIYSCAVDGFAYRLKEGDWTFTDSIRYTAACDTIGGTSGSPVIDTATGKVIAVNNTGNESGGRCTLNNPCEVDQNGTVTVRQGINYAQQTYTIAPCVGTGNTIDLSRSGCALPKP
ncbi:S1 family peptidase [Streptomyces sp. enrichment culture]|uniref:S1 family peptidase n=1 Tax=Streptomyces sp. enrichment culture TaxID=1795815 RepID=UPI003F57036D